MRVSAVRMGVKNLFPLIKTNAPHAIRSLQRWEGVRGWRLAFDGTLLLAKLHFSSSSPHRHLMGLHHLLTSLRAAGVGSIFVFDHPASTARLPQKAREHAKRREARAKIAQRGRTEQKRMARIEELRRCLALWAGLSTAEQRTAARWLEKWEQSRDVDEVESALEEEEVRPLRGVEEEDEALAPAWLDKELQQELHQLSTEVDVESFIDTMATTSTSSSSSTLLTPRPRTHITSYAEEFQVTRDLLAPPAPPLSPWDAILEDQTSPAYAVAHRIARLRFAYAAQGAGAETSLQALLTAREGELYKALQRADSVALGKLGELDLETEVGQEPETEQVEIPMDKGEIVPPPPPPQVTEVQPEEAPLPPEELLDSISLTNAHLAASYARHSNHLTSSIIRSAAELCTLHGIPVLWTGSGEPGKRPHEAEAVAARVVRDGYADAVVSEDSDTLLYDVPLIRGALGREEGFEIVDPKEVRKAFFPLPEGEAVRLDEEERQMEEDAEAMFEKQLADVEMLKPEEEGAEAHVAAPPSAATTRKRTPTATVPKDEESWRRMLELALLCGTDFNRTVPGIASVRALKFVRQYGRIRTILESEVVPVKSAKEGTASSSGSKKKRTSPSVPVTAADVSAPVKPKTTPRFTPPDALTWRAYSKELTQARAVFLNMPSLHREAARLKAWNQAFSSAASAGGAFDVDRVAIAQFWRARVKATESKDTNMTEQDEWEVRRVVELAEAVAQEGEVEVGSGRERRRTSKATLGFGENPFGDKPAAQGLGESAVWRG